MKYKNFSIACGCYQSSENKDVTYDCYVVIGKVSTPARLELDHIKDSNIVAVKW